MTRSFSLEIRIRWGHYMHLCFYNSVCQSQQCDERKEKKKHKKKIENIRIIFYGIWSWVKQKCKRLSTSRLKLKWLNYVNKLRERDREINIQRHTHTHKHIHLVCRTILLGCITHKATQYFSSNEMELCNRLSHRRKKK